jgi:hypothetical protein
MQAVDQATGEDLTKKQQAEGRPAPKASRVIRRTRLA